MAKIDNFNTFILNGNEIIQHLLLFLFQNKFEYE